MRRLPGWRLLALVAGIGAVTLTSGPIRDPDVFWHTLVGQYTLDGKGFPRPDPFAFSLPSTHWHTTSWLSELLLAGVYDTAGLAGIVALRLLLGLALVCALYRLLVAGSEGWQGATVFSIVVLPLTDYVQERPQTVSLVLCCWLAATARSFLLQDRLPRRWLFIGLTYLWALLHGLFVLAPAVLGLLAVGALLDGGRRRLPEVRSLAITAGLATVACAATPMGPRLLLAPLTVGSAAKDYIAEWFPTQLTTIGTFALVGVLAVTVAAWARSTDPRPRSQLLWTLVLAFFGFLATRNAGPAAILLAPMAVVHAERTWSSASTVDLPRRPVLALASFGLLVAMASYVGKPVLAKDEPVRIAAYLGAQQGPVRVLNDYNISGYLLREAWPHIRVAIDGRADRYGHGFLKDYSDAVNGKSGWREFVEDQHVDLVVLKKDQPLTQLLLLADWRTVMTDRTWVLLAPAGTT